MVTCLRVSNLRTQKFFLEQKRFKMKVPGIRLRRSVPLPVVQSTGTWYKQAYSSAVDD